MNIRQSFKRSFLAGLFLLMPLGISWIALQFLIEKVGAPTSKYLFHFFQIPGKNFGVGELFLNVLAILLVIGFISIIGYLSNYFLGKTLISLTERIIQRLPFIRSIYSTTKQIIETFTSQKQPSFQKAVLVEFPCKNTYMIGFMTSENGGEISEKTNEEMVNVLIPTTPNPTSGFLVLVPKKALIVLEMSAADAIKMIISGGAIAPAYPTMTKLKNAPKEDQSKKDS